MIHLIKNTNYYCLLFIINISILFDFSSNLSKHSPIFSPDRLYINENNNTIINDIRNSIYIDPINLNCNIKFIETIDLAFNNPTDTVYYIVISRKLSLRSFSPSLLNKDISIIRYEVYNDLSHKQRTFYDEDEKRKLSFRDKWLICITLSKPVKRIQINIEYYADRGVLIDNESEDNIIDLSFFNPYSTSINYMIFIVLSNIKDFDIKRMSIPYDAVINNKKENKEIYIHRTFHSFTKHDISLYLPLFISDCDGGFINFLFYGLILSTTTFGFISLMTLIYLYKE